MTDEHPENVGADDRGQDAKSIVESEPTISSDLDDELSASADSYISPARTDAPHGRAGAAEGDAADE